MNMYVVFALFFLSSAVILACLDRLKMRYAIALFMVLCLVLVAYIPLAIWGGDITEYCQQCPQDSVVQSLLTFANRKIQFSDFAVSSATLILAVIAIICATSIEKGGFWKALYCVALPSIALGLHHVASLARYTRSSMLDVLNQDYIRTAKAKGLSQGKIYYKHALKNTLSIVATLVANSIASMLGGAVVTERVFNIRGMGTLAVDSLTRRDYSQEQAIVLLTAVICLGVNLVMDIIYKLLDPRIEYE